MKHFNESILDNIESRDLNKSSAEEIVSNASKRKGRYLYQFTVNLNLERYNGPASDIFDAIIEKIEYYLNTLYKLNINDLDEKYKYPKCEQHNTIYDCFCL